ncbi:hypothetical protein DIPPA_10163 [Diplonema papillatum]|nr:hypothetical protein DIPPA_02582 [Diplonema papillatum]KAJ9453275.1 hypothetical protein DIPPA_10163 [Diplonema papillatum]
MAIPTRDDLDLSVVKWKDVPVPKADEPDGVKKAMPSEQCVFYPTCDTLHTSEITCRRCGGVGESGCLQTRLKGTAAVLKKFTLPEDAADQANWICPPCCWVIHRGGPLVDPESIRTEPEEDLSGLEGMTISSDDGLPEGALTHSDPVVRALAERLVQQSARMRAMEHNHIRVPLELDVRRVKEWESFLDSAGGTETLLTRVRERYGPLLERPDSEGTGAQHSLRHLWSVLSDLRNPKGAWSKDLLPALHKIMVRMESLHLQSRPGNEGYAVAVARGASYETYLLRVQWQDFSDRVLRGAMKASQSSDAVVLAKKQRDSKAPYTNKRPAEANADGQHSKRRAKNGYQKGGN